MEVGNVGLTRNDKTSTAPKAEPEPELHKLQREVQAA